MLFWIKRLLNYKSSINHYFDDKFHLGDCTGDWNISFLSLRQGSETNFWHSKSQWYRLLSFVISTVCGDFLSSSKLKSRNDLINIFISFLVNFSFFHKNLFFTSAVVWVNGAWDCFLIIHFYSYYKNLIFKMAYLNKRAILISS